MIALLGGLLPACINDEEDTNAKPEKSNGFNISIALSAGDAAMTRAEDGLDEIDGSVAENYINVDDLQIYAFSTDGTLLAQVYPKPTTGSNVAMDPLIFQIGNMYYLKAELSYDTFSQPENQEFKLVAVANWRTTDNMETLPALNEDNSWNDLVTKTYEKSYIDENDVTKAKMWTPKDGDGIPMFGVQTVSLSGYDSRYNNESNPFTLEGETGEGVNMLRAMAKIEVIDNIKKDGTSIVTSVSLNANCYHTKGYVVPKVQNGIKNTTNIEEANIPDAPVAGTLPLPFFQEGNTFVAYVPEFALTGSNRKAITVTIGQATYTLSLAPYDANGQPNEGITTYPWNALLRNHIYRYTIEGVGQEMDNITITYTVCPWLTNSIDIPIFD